MSSTKVYKVGVGVTTFNRPECLKECLEHINKHTYMSNVVIHVEDENDIYERMGIAFRKNMCLRALKDCDFVFLFDDDTFPIKDGWIDFFVNSGEEHLLFLNFCPVNAITGNPKDIPAAQ